MRSRAASASSSLSRPHSEPPGGVPPLQERLRELRREQHARDAEERAAQQKPAEELAHPAAGADSGVLRRARRHREARGAERGGAAEDPRPPTDRSMRGCAKPGCWCHDSSLFFANGNRDERDAVAARAVAGARRGRDRGAARRRCWSRGGRHRREESFFHRDTHGRARCATATHVFRMHSQLVRRGFSSATSRPRRGGSARAMPRFAHFSYQRSVCSKTDKHNPCGRNAAFSARLFLARVRLGTSAAHGLPRARSVLAPSVGSREASRRTRVRSETWKAGRWRLSRPRRRPRWVPARARSPPAAACGEVSARRLAGSARRGRRPAVFPRLLRARTPRRW